MCIRVCNSEILIVRVFVCVCMTVSCGGGVGGVVCVGGKRYLIERKDLTVRIDSTGDLPASRLTFKCLA